MCLTQHSHDIQIFNVLVSEITQLWKEGLNSVGQQYQQSEQPSLTSNNTTKTWTYVVVNPGLGQAKKCSEVKPINGSQPTPSDSGNWTTNDNPPPLFVVTGSPTTTHPLWLW
jgi:hypothetical protein